MEALATTAADAPADDSSLRRFHALYRGEFAFVWSAAQHLGVPSGQVDEVVQDVFLTAYRRLDHLKFEVSPRAWLYGVTRRVAFRYRRGAARRARRLAHFAELPRPVSASPQQRHDDAQQLERLLAPLGEGTRAVWELTEILGMSAPEIASELGLPLATVYSRLRLARTQLARHDPEQLAAWRDAVKHLHAAPPTAERRSWAVLLPALGKPTGALGLLAWVKAHAAMTTLWISVGAASLGVVVIAASDRAPAAPATPAKIAAPPPAPLAAVAPTPPEIAPTRRRSEPAPRDRLAEEIAVIDRLHAALAADDLAGARQIVGEHARRFPKGALADVREAARIDALCREHAPERAEAAARALLANYPDSAVAQRFVDFSCPW